MSMDYVAPAMRTACTVCGEEFGSRGDLVTHVRAEHSHRHLSPAERPRNRGPIPCGHPGCDYSFKSNSGAGQHRRAKHGA